jgi:hypothetical protein
MKGFRPLPALFVWALLVFPASTLNAEERIDNPAAELAGLLEGYK